MRVRILEAETVRLDRKTGYCRPPNPFHPRQVGISGSSVARVCRPVVSEDEEKSGKKRKERGCPTCNPRVVVAPWRTVMTFRASPRSGDFNSPSLRSAPPSARAHTLSLELQNLLTCNYPALVLNSTDHEMNVAQRWALSLAGG